VEVRHNASNTHGHTDQHARAGRLDRRQRLRLRLGQLAGLLESVRLDIEPPSLVEQANAAVRWLSQAIVELDQDAADATAAITDGLARVLSLEVFAAVVFRAVKSDS
jgi:hypothetical protein